MLVFSARDMFLDEDRYAEYQAFEAAQTIDPDQAIDDGPVAWQSRMFGYRATVATLRRRLDLQGFGAGRVRALAEAMVESELAGDPEYPLPDPRDSWPEGQGAYPDGASVVAALASARGRRAAMAIQPAKGEQSFLHAQWEDLAESFDDQRFALALSLMSTKSNVEVMLDLTPLILGGWMEITDRPHEDARRRMTQTIAASGPVIVIAEGATDARWMRRAMEVAAPEVAHLFEFLDFAGYKAPGGLDRVVSLTKGMAAAGVMNRIVAILDNDTAGCAAAAQLRSQKLPDRVTVTTLPEVPYGRRYPTLGPGGVSSADINGRAVAIEMMFGEDILRDDASGTLFPVRWQGWNQAEGKYQGSLDGVHKKTVERRLDEALDVRRSELIGEQVAEGCRRLADLLVSAAHRPLLVPATDRSELSASWRNGLNL